MVSVSGPSSVWPRNNSRYSQDPHHTDGHKRISLLLQLHYPSVSKGCFCRLIYYQCIHHPLCNLHLRILLVLCIPCHMLASGTKVLRNSYHRMTPRGKHTCHHSQPSMHQWGNQKFNKSVLCHSHHLQYMIHFLQLFIQYYLRRSNYHYSTNWNSYIRLRSYHHQCTLY